MEEARRNSKKSTVSACFGKKPNGLLGLKGRNQLRQHLAARLGILESIAKPRGLLDEK